MFVCLSRIDFLFEPKVGIKNKYTWFNYIYFRLNKIIFFSKKKVYLLFNSSRKSTWFNFLLNIYDHLFSIIHYSFKYQSINILYKVCNAINDSSSQRCYICDKTISNFNNLEDIQECEIDETKLVYGLSPLHAKLRFLDCVLHICYRHKIFLRNVSIESIKASIIIYVIISYHL